MEIAAGTFPPLYDARSIPVHASTSRSVCQSYIVEVRSVVSRSSLPARACSRSSLRPSRAALLLVIQAKHLVAKQFLVGMGSQQRQADLCSEALEFRFGPAQTRAISARNFGAASKLSETVSMAATFTCNTLRGDPNVPDHRRLDRRKSHGTAASRQVAQTARSRSSPDRAACRGDAPHAPSLRLRRTRHDRALLRLFVSVC
jgi:hypothetical protein